METVKGIDRILLFRLLSQNGEKDASKLAYQTEHEISSSVDVDSYATKDGRVQSAGQAEITISATSVLAKNDKLVDDLWDAHLKNEIVEIWDIDRSAEATSGKFKATYYQGYITDYSQNPNAEDDIELSLEFVINGTGARGEATLSEEQAKVVQYVFEDTTAKQE
ncbi:phage major tail protein, TP901-1 family [Allofustis seminis]|uniref:phage major tail protein, TP901-1 family n=1 Tax=Allofustis seminis TaxID=166939 RepID=UPI00036A1E5B|nr:phage major tail protein, TP901-1 family [Allofustis seminis]